MTDLRKAIEQIGSRRLAPESDGPVCLKPSERERILIGPAGEGTYSVSDGGHTVTLQPGSGIDTVIVEDRGAVCHYQRDPSNGRIAFSGVLAGPNIRPETIDEHSRWIESAYLMCGKTLDDVALKPDGVPHSSAYEEGLG